jgi:hypothetical protein
MKKCIYFCIFLFIIHPVYVSGSDRWKQLKTKHTVVFYRDRGDLDVLEKKLRMGVFLGLFALSKEVKNHSASLLKKKIDRIFESNQDVLEIKGMKERVNIYVHADQREVDLAHRDIIKRYEMSPSAHQSHIAFYFHGEKAVHISLEKVTEGVLAHELGHAILDHHLLVPPPKVVGELVARHVEKHLKRW